MNEVETLRAAAQKVRETESRATPGPWSASPVWSPRSLVTSAVYSHAHRTGTPESEVIPSRRAKPDRVHVRPGDAAWIALMHPGIGPTIAEWLEGAADDLASALNAYPFADEECDLEELLDLADEPDSVRHALNLARLITGETGGRS